MIKHSTTIEIARPPSEVFAVLLDMERYGEWTEMVDSRYETAGDPRVGSRGTFRFLGGPLKGTLRFQITELTPDRQVTFQVHHPVAEWTSVSRLEPSDGGTRLEYAGVIRMRGWRRLLEPLMAGEVQRGEEKEVLRLKALLERPTVEATATA
jgi:carbon monoxide dehydrogenase subunit G